MAVRTLLPFLLLCAFLPSAASADPAPFDLAGPRLQIMVRHGGETLPVSEVPNLAAGDKLMIKPNFPADQSAHYVLVAAFLRGATNPPPKNWFFAAETWKKKEKDGLAITVPAGARQVVLFLAPETGGDFDTLMDAVRGRPGAFVRASQDLNQASLDRSRLDAFLRGIRRGDRVSPGRLEEVSPMLARSLAIKLNADCLQKLPDLQAACLTQGGDSLVLSDGHSTSIAETLTGTPADLAMQISATPQGGLGYYSPYIGVVRDVARLLGAFQTAQYQYIPALPIRRGPSLSLLLNAVPSFHKPKSVLVTALPAVDAPRTPPLRAAPAENGFCLANPNLVLPIEGAPLVYSTDYAHNMALRLQTKDGRVVDLPARADAEDGGFVIDNGRFDGAAYGGTINAALHGYWGFQPFEGPRFILQNPKENPWRIAPQDQQALVVGRDATVRLDGNATACVENVTLRYGSGMARDVDWKVAGPDSLTLKLPLAAASPGAMTLLIKQYGADEPTAVTLQAYAEGSRMGDFFLHAGDNAGLLTGSRLDEVASLSFGGVTFKPAGLKRVKGTDQLAMKADGQGGAGLAAGQSGAAKIALKDGRTANLNVTVASPRPTVTLISKNIALAPSASPIVIHLANDDALPSDAHLTFSIHAGQGTRFTGKEKIEIAAANGTASTLLESGQGLTLEGAQVAVAAFDPARAFGTAAFGPLRFRLVRDDTTGDWQPLATLVRLPRLEAVRCEGSAGPCTLTGSQLFLINAISADRAFTQPVTIPEGFTGNTLQVPRPQDGRLYLKLNDEPDSINEAVLPH